jgi:hypothetical protein
MGRRRAMSEQSANLLLLQLALLVSFGPLGYAREGPTPVLSTGQIVEKLMAANARRAQALQAYRGKRSYTLEYHGFPGGRSADMSVEATYTAPDKKEFNIVAQNGSKLLLTRVLQKLVESEKEAMQEDNRRATELSPRNYEFTFLQMDRTPQGNAYVLEVKPRVNYKFLYRGKIWVDTQDFAVEHMEGEPAKNPSFWISRTHIEQRYGKFGDFWLPIHNQSVTKVRLGGEAVLNISYTDYEINGTRQAGGEHPANQEPVMPLTPSNPSN